MRRRLGSAKRRVVWMCGATFAPIGFVWELVLALRTRARLAAFRKRGAVVRRFPEPTAETRTERVLAVVTHVADVERPNEESVARLSRTLDGLVESLGHTSLELVVLTCPGRHVIDALSPQLRKRVSIREHDDIHPLLLGFKAQDAFVERIGDIDWFVYLEDDIVLQDSFILDKLAFFNAGTPPGALLLPHRYELSQGRKTYIDLVSKTSASWCPANRLTALDVGPWSFAEFQNPHSGFYCLSQGQLRAWEASGRRWYGKLSYVASRESAATGCLGEVFRLYKPHPRNMTFLEVRHWDTRYSEFYRSLHASMHLAPG